MAISIRLGIKQSMQASFFGFANARLWSLQNFDRTAAVELNVETNTNLVTLVECTLELTFISLIFRRNS